MSLPIVVIGSMVDMNLVTWNSDIESRLSIFAALSSQYCCSVSHYRYATQGVSTVHLPSTRFQPSCKRWLSQRSNMHGKDKGKGKEDVKDELIPWISDNNIQHSGDLGCTSRSGHNEIFGNQEPHSTPSWQSNCPTHLQEFNEGWYQK